MESGTAKTLGVISVVLGALTAGVEVIGGLCCGWIVWPLAIAATILGILAWTSARGDQTAATLGKIGICLSLIVPIWQLLTATILAGLIHR